MMTRRGFLSGTLVAAAGAGTALLVATPDEVAAFGKPLVGPVSVLQPELVPDAGSSVKCGEPVFNVQGRMIGIVTVFQITRQSQDVTPFAGMWQNFYVDGLVEVTYTVQGTGMTRI